MTTRTIREMITITSNTRTAAATVSSERRAGGRERERGAVENLHKHAEGQGGRGAVSGPELSHYWIGEDQNCSAHFRDGQDPLSVMRIQFFSWQQKGQNAIGNTILSPKVFRH